MHLTSRQTVAIGTSCDLPVKIGGVNNERTNAAARVRSVTAKDDSFPRDLVSVATFSCRHTTLRGALSGEGGNGVEICPEMNVLLSAKNLVSLPPSNANPICVHQGVEMSRLKMNGSIFSGN